MPTAKVRDVSLFYEVQGEGPPLVFVHGLGGTSNVWYAQRAVLSRSCRVVTFDLSGSGRSDHSRRTYSIETWADEIAGLMEHLNIEQAIVIGHSMGTVIVQKFATRYPQKTKAIVLAGALIELAPQGKEAFTRRAETAEREGMIGVADMVLQGALTPGTRERNLVLTGMVREMLLANDPPCYAGQCRALIAASAKADHAQIKCPTLLVVGDHDTVTPLANHRQIAAAVANSRIRIVPNTAHLTMMEMPEMFNVILLEFLATL